MGGDFVGCEPKNISLRSVRREISRIFYKISRREDQRESLASRLQAMPTCDVSLYILSGRLSTYAKNTKLLYEYMTNCELSASYLTVSNNPKNGELVNYRLVRSYVI